jgi:hypothetical protein
MAIDGGMNSQSLITAKKHVYNVAMNGSNIVLVSSDSNKDEFGTVKSENTLSLKSFPTRYSPYDRDVIQKIGWAENTEILCYIPKLQIDKLNLTIQTMRKIYKEFRHNKKTYEIRYIEPYSAFANDFLYIVIGGKS